MSLKVAQRYAFPEKEPDRFHEIHLKDMGTIELAFHNYKRFMKINHKKVCRQILDAQWIHVAVIHLPSFKLENHSLSLKIFDKAFQMAYMLECSLMVIHPSRSPMERVKDFLEREVVSLARFYGVKLCWETFLGEKRFLVGVDEIARLVKAFTDVYAICYDTAHMRMHEEVLQEIKTYMHLISVMHISNHTESHKQLHIPIFHPRGVLDFSEILHLLRKGKFQGWVVLEYLPVFLKRQHVDYSILKRL